MRILHISTRLILGGSQENTVLSCEGQARRGHEVHLAFGPIYGPEGSLLDRVQTFRTDDGRAIATHVVPHLIRAVNPYADVLAYRELRALITRLKPDIVHTHSSKAGILGRWAAWSVRGGRRAGDRVVGAKPPKSGFAGREREEIIDNVNAGIIHTIHGPPFMPVEGSAISRAKTRFNNWLYTRTERFAAKRCHVIVSVADAMTRQFLARGIGRPGQYTTVRSGMETEPFLHAGPGESRADIRARLGLSETDFVVGTVARLAQHKGHDDLLDALADELKRTPRLKLLWVGDGWWRERLLTKARSLGLAFAELDRPASPTSDLPSPTSLSPSTPRHLDTSAPSPPTSSLRHSVTPSLLLTGLVPPTRIPGLIRAMDILAHPSYREGLPRTVPQALLSNVCPVAYDCDGTGEVLRNNETGRLVPTGDINALRDAILWLMTHDAERAAMAARGRDECAATFSTDRMVSDLDSVYARALALAQR